LPYNFIFGWLTINEYVQGKTLQKSKDKSFDTSTASSLAMVFSKGRGKKNVVPFIALVALYIGTLAV